MMLRTLEIAVDDRVLADLGISAQELSEEAPFLLAAKLYEMGRLSSSQAARLSGFSRWGFLEALARHGIPASNLRSEDAAEELEFSRGG